MTSALSSGLPDWSLAIYSQLHQYTAESISLELESLKGFSLISSLPSNLTAGFSAKQPVLFFPDSAKASLNCLLRSLTWYIYEGDSIHKQTNREGGVSLCKIWIWNKGVTWNSELTVMADACNPRTWEGWGYPDPVSKTNNQGPLIGFKWRRKKKYLPAFTSHPQISASWTASYFSDSSSLM